MEKVTKKIYTARMESSEKLDRDIRQLQAAKNKWVALPVDRKITLLKELKYKLGKHARQWVDLSVKHKKIENHPSLAGEEWSTGPWAVLKAITAYIKTLEHVLAGNPQKLIKKISQRKNGQLKLTVFPSDFYDSLLFNQVEAEVWMQEGISKNNLASHIASFYRRKTPKGKVSLVLGAGNVNSISPLDVLYKLFVKGEVVILKLNPVNNYLTPVFKEIARTLIEEDFLRIVDGGAETGEYLTRHPGIETIHVTGSEKTFNAIVFGTGPEGEKRKKENRPVMDPGKTITGELGNVGPLIVVPGPWHKSDIRFQAENIVTAKVHNGGYNCVAAQVLFCLKNGISRKSC
ncbi:MAG: aldehyde dehydrogenase [Chlorobi bacterium]|nr:aldehyde dehydrogenase [Chlorobiota bacterium]